MQLTGSVDNEAGEDPTLVSHVVLIHSAVSAV